MYLAVKISTVQINKCQPHVGRCKQEAGWGLCGTISKTETSALQCTGKNGTAEGQTCIMCRVYIT